MNRFTIVAFGMACGVMGIFMAYCAYAITPPPPVPPKVATILYSWTPAPLRADLVTPMPASERKETRLYITSLPAYIAVPEPATSFTYIVPSGQCIKKTDSAAATTVDTAGLESAASLSVSTSEDVCTGKSLPGAPANVKISVG